MRLSDLSIRRKILMGAALMIIFIVPLAYMVDRITSQIGATATAALQENQKDFHATSELIRLTKQIQIDVIQVQQWLTDISATRGLDGLNDGFDEAAGFAGRLPADIASARKVAAEMQLAEYGSILGSVEKAFPPFYETGQKMANAYVAEGPAGGNPLMADFDAAAEEMYGSLEKLLEIQQHVVADAETRIAGHVAEFEALDGLRKAAVAAAALVTMIFAGIAGWSIWRAFARPIIATSGIMNRLSSGNLDIDVDFAHRGDEIGTMGRSILVFRDNARERERLAVDAARREQRTEAERVEMRRRAAEDVHNLLGEAIDALDQNSRLLSDAATQLTDIAHQSSDRTEIVAGAAEEASRNVELVATATEELVSSIGEISSQVGRATRVVDFATNNADTSNSRIGALAQAVQKIGDVVSLIQDIAEQTNLLALNATIEAARAGEMGKGFAVVASEVKSLATQTAKATEEISGQIAGIQASTAEAVSAIQGITTTMREIYHYTSAIASAVEEQGSSTGEISRSVQQAAIGTQSVASNIVGVRSSVDETSQSARQVLGASREVADQAARLRKAMNRIVAELAA
ncbi:MAG: HAMP domain-containing methyl-accepting chemotaxis protein [Hyphomicrobiales bacterium]